MTEGKTLEERVAAFEARLLRLETKRYDQLSWTDDAGDPPHSHGLKPLAGGSTGRPLLGFAPSGPVNFCQQCGEPPESHPCPELET